MEILKVMISKYNIMTMPRALQPITTENAFFIAFPHQALTNIDYIVNPKQFQQISELSHSKDIF